MRPDSPEKHWETIYTNQKDHKKAGWYQPTPALVFEWLNTYVRIPHPKIIDIGGGDSYFCDHALKRGFHHLTVLDISEKALSKARTRLGSKAKEIRWLHKNVLEYTPSSGVDVWHDRAAFHFLCTPNDKQAYKAVLEKALAPGGYIILATFSKQGPETCSGLPVERNSLEDLTSFLGNAFELLEHQYHDHYTPSGTHQHYIYTLFRKKTL